MEQIPDTFNEVQNMKIDKSYALGKNILVLFLLKQHGHKRPLNDVLSYPKIRISLNHHKRSFFL